MPPPDILSDLTKTRPESRGYNSRPESRVSDASHGPMTDVIAQLSDVMDKRQTVGSSKMNKANVAEVKLSELTPQFSDDHENDTMTDVATCLAHIDSLLATPEMINLPQRDPTMMVRSQIISLKVRYIVHTSP